MSSEVWALQRHLFSSSKREGRSKFRRLLGSKVNVLSLEESDSLRVSDGAATGALWAIASCSLVWRTRYSHVGMRAPEAPGVM